MIENWINMVVLLCFFEVRICCGKSERAPRFYFAGRSGIIASNEDERL